MKTIQPLIDAGFRTVPLHGELKRTDTGKKTTPMFEKNWKSKYQQEFNTNATPIGGILTGAISNLIAIDCDDAATYELFSSLDISDNHWHFVSKDKPSGGGTILYSYPDPTLYCIDSFSIQDDNFKLDFYSDNGFVYAPTDENLTKHAWLVEEFTALPPILTAPPSVLTLLKALHKQYTLLKAPRTEPIPQERVHHTYLAPQLQLMLDKAAFMPSVFRILTPRDFRSLDQYVTFGYLHPSSVPEGRGSEYLSKVSAILGADPSVSPDLYQKTMLFINDLWDEPMQKSRLESTIMQPMLSGNAAINGEAIWKYDEYWDAKGMTFTTKLGDAAEAFFDDSRALYYIVNHTALTCKTFDSGAECYAYMEATARGIIDRKNFKSAIPLVRASVVPAREFGFYNIDEYTRGFNLFKQTPALAILNSPEPFTHLYVRPETTIAYFKTLVPDPIMRNYLLRFVKRKLLTFSYSPVVLYFLGAHGSGKDTFVNILATIVGESSIAKPTTKEFLEHFNGWIVDTYFTQLDEYGNQLNKMADKQEALGKIKAYSGKETIQIRQMRTDGFSYAHATTFILTANTNPLILEDGDRRTAYLETPNVLKDQPWVVAAGGMAVVHAKIMAEVSHFCYYLATEIDSASADEYMSPPFTKHKHELIASKLNPAYRIAYYLKHNIWDQLEQLCHTYDSLAVFDFAAEGKMFDDDLFDLYSKLTDDGGTKRGLTAALAEIADKVPTTRNNQKAYYYKLPNLTTYKRKYMFVNHEDDVDVAF
jgi:hypothetical protein